MGFPLAYLDLTLACYVGQFERRKGKSPNCLAFLFYFQTFKTIFTNILFLENEMAIASLVFTKSEAATCSP